MVTTAGYVVGNLVAMPTKRLGSAAGPRPRPRRTFIREWRKFRDNMSQERLAELAGTTKATISRIETGDIKYTQGMLEAIADALGTHPGLLLMRPPGPADAYPDAPREQRASLRKT